ncbi:GNAT family N-acetyltransferase [Oceanobacillus sp. Castelsardo]|uniref:GNAT family N-acetyltransferase n=1 Tax=Oceanobacillus sp. Castelsardo TaxID=1851204 RepID=UPI000838FAE2|nr:GNAT family N-acetyltransferase [Oceanobacillus sp. Castelsardo]
MQLLIQKMTEKYAIEALCWKYEKPYNFYNNVLSGSAIMELLTNRYFVVLNEKNQLIGYFCVGKSARVPNGEVEGLYKEKCVDIGVGMRPELTGKGYGYLFFSTILEFVQENHVEKDLRLTVASFNQRAIHLYEKFGFVVKRRFTNKKVEFLIMKRKGDKGRM